MFLLKAKKAKFESKNKPNVAKNAAIMGIHLAELRHKLEKLGTYGKDVFEEAKRKLKQEIDL